MSSNSATVSSVGAYSFRVGLWRCVVVIVHAMWLPHATAAGSDADYLQALDREAGKMEFLGKARQEREQLDRSAGVKPALQPTTKVVVAPTTPEQRAEFEKLLKTNFPSSYTLYTDLGQNAKDSVYQQYEQSEADGITRFRDAISKIIAIASGIEK